MDRNTYGRIVGGCKIYLPVDLGRMSSSEASYGADRRIGGLSETFYVEKFLDEKYWSQNRPPSFWQGNRGQETLWADVRCICSLTQAGYPCQKQVTGGIGG